MAPLVLAGRNQFQMSFRIPVNDAGVEIKNNKSIVQYKLVMHSIFSL